MKTTSILLSLVLAAAFGCNKAKDDKKEDPATAGKTTGTEPATPDPAAAADAAPAAGTPKEIPTEQDFEEKAAAEVTKDNVEAEVEKLEKEISAEVAAPPAGGSATAPAGGGEKK